MKNLDLETIIIIIGAIIPVLEIIVRLTPSEKDNSIVNKIKRFYDKWFPNKSISNVSKKDNTITDKDGNFK